MRLWIRAVSAATAAACLALFCACGAAFTNENTSGKAAVGDAPGESALGDIRFAPDAARFAQGEYLPEGDGLTLELTDAQGLTWKLELPPGACPTAQTISMTALADVQSDALSSARSGVLLEPDGLRFARAARLSVSGQASEKLALLTADHQGGHAGYAPGAREGDALFIPLTHFSSSFAFEEEDSGLKRLSSDVKRALKSATGRAKELLGQPVDVVFAPDISFACSAASCDGPDTAGLEEFLSALLSPELAYIEELSMAAKNYGLVCGSDNVYEGAMTLLTSLTARYAQKADKLIAAHSFAPEKCLAVSRGVIQMLTYCQLAGAELDYEAYFATLAEWLEKAAGAELEKLRTRHDFKAVHAVLRIAREAGYIGRDTSHFIAELEQAMRTKLTFTTSIHIAGADVSYDLAGDIVIPYALDAAYQVGSGTGKHTGYVSPEPDLKLVLAGFEVTAAIENFNPCKDAAIPVYIDRFGVENETYVLKGYPAPSGTGIANSIAKWAFDDRGTLELPAMLGLSAALFRFELPFANASEPMAEQLFTETVDQATIRYQLTLLHTPQ